MRGLTDQPPVGADPTQRAVWEALYWRGETLYRNFPQYVPHVADKIYNDLWTPAGRLRTPPTRGKMPDPGNMVWLGYTMALQYFDPGSSEILKVHKFPNLPDCLWSPRLQAVMVYPRLRVPLATVMPEDVPELLKIYQQWHDGKYPKHGAAKVKLPDPPVKAIYPAAAIVYRSDKFDDDGEWVDYIHHHDKGAGGRPGPMVYDGGTAWMLRGGRLALTKDGLIH